MMMIRFMKLPDLDVRMYRDEILEEVAKRAERAGSRIRARQLRLAARRARRVYTDRAISSLDRDLSA